MLTGGRFCMHPLTSRYLLAQVIWVVMASLACPFWSTPVFTGVDHAELSEPSAVGNTAADSLEEQTLCGFPRTTDRYTLLSRRLGVFYHSCCIVEFHALNAVPQCDIVISERLPCVASGDPTLLLGTLEPEARIFVACAVLYSVSYIKCNTGNASACSRCVLLRPKVVHRLRLARSNKYFAVNLNA